MFHVILLIRLSVVCLRYISYYLIAIYINDNAYDDGRP